MDVDEDVDVDVDEDVDEGEDVGEDVYADGGEGGSLVSRSTRYLYLGKVERYCPGVLYGHGVWDAHF